MKNNEATIFVFLASLIIGILISLNINFNKTYNRIFLDTKQYQETYQEKVKLHDDISNLVDQYNYYYVKLMKYQNAETSQYQFVRELKDELNNNKTILGMTDVDGEGIKITLNDASEDIINSIEDPVLRLTRLVHNYDVVNVINDIRNSGAEAISINGQRIIDRTEVYCNGPFLEVNQIKIAAPFYISAIGKKEALSNFMLLDENYLKILINRQINVQVQELKDIKIPAYRSGISRVHLAAVSK